MEDLYTRIKTMCDEKGITINRMCKESGASQGAIGDLKAGRTKKLSAQNLSRISDYFGVTIDLLLGNKEKPADEGELAEYLEDLRERPETRALLEASRGMTREQVEKMADFAKMLRGGENESN